MIEKKRELLPDLHELIKKLSGISGDLAKLELFDNWSASARGVKELIKTRGEIAVLIKKIRMIKSEIRVSKGGEPLSYVKEAEQTSV